jgi:hypothetical protein
VWFRCLLLKLVERSLGSKHPQLMLRRTESIVEKMLTNWLALCLYDYMKDYAGSSLFVLFKAIKFQVRGVSPLFISVVADPRSDAFLSPGSGIGKKSRSGNITDHISQSLETIF